MIDHFYDSSSIAKLFIQERGTAEMVHLYASAERRFVSRLASIEVHSVIARLEREENLSSVEAQLARESLTRQEAVLEIIELAAGVVSTAQALLKRHTLRSLDAIQLASALSVNSVAFICSDKRLLSAATAEGLHVIDPMTI